MIFSPLLLNAPSAAATLLALWLEDAVDDREETDFLAAVLAELIGAVDDEAGEADEALCGALRTSTPADGEAAAEGDDFTLSADLARATIEFEGGEEDFSTGGVARASASGGV